MLHIYRQAPGGSIKLITVPHTNGDNRVLTARGSRLLVEAPTDCTGSVSLLRDALPHVLVQSSVVPSGFRMLKENTLHA